VALRLGKMVQAAAWLDGLTAPQARINHGFALLGLAKRRWRCPTSMRLALSASQRRSLFRTRLALESLGRRAEAAAAFTGIAGTLTRHLSAPVAREHLRRLATRLSV